MCNCLTLRMEKYARAAGRERRTYTAHQLSTDLFLKFAKPGVTIPLPYKALYPKDVMTEYAIPNQTNTFLFSTFNEVFHPAFYFTNSNARYTVQRTISGKIDTKFSKLLKNATGKCPTYTVDNFVKDLARIDTKVNLMWGNILKILIFYDYSWSRSEPLKKRFIQFNRAAKRTVDWPVIQVVRDTQEPHPKKQKRDWAHYNEIVYLDLYDKISAMEEEYNVC